MLQRRDTICYRGNSLPRKVKEARPVRLRPDVTRTSRVVFGWCHIDKPVSLCLRQWHRLTFMWVSAFLSSTRQHLSLSTLPYCSECATGNNAHLTRLIYGSYSASVLNSTMFVVETMTRCSLKASSTAFEWCWLMLEAVELLTSQSFKRIFQGFEIFFFWLEN